MRLIFATNGLIMGDLIQLMSQFLRTNKERGGKSTRSQLAKAGEEVERGAGREVRRLVAQLRED